MCMVSRSKKYKRAKENIEIYAIKTKVKEEKFYRSVVYKSSTFELNKKYIDDHFIPPEDLKNYEKRVNEVYRAYALIRRIDGYEIDRGYHTSPSKHSLVLSLQRDEWMYNQTRACDFVILRGYIPKGALYLEGINHRCSDTLNNTPSYVSNEVVFKKEVFSKNHSGVKLKETLL